MFYFEHNHLFFHLNLKTIKNYILLLDVESIFLKHLISKSVLRILLVLVSSKL